MRSDFSLLYTEIRLTLLYYYHHHRGTRLNTMKRLLCLQPMFPPNELFDNFSHCLAEIRRNPVRKGRFRPLIDVSIVILEKMESHFA